MVCLHNEHLLLWELLAGSAQPGKLKHYINNTVLVQVTCEEDSVFEQIVQTAVSKLHQSLVPIQFNK